MQGRPPTGRFLGFTLGFAALLIWMRWGEGQLLGKQAAEWGHWFQTNFSGSTHN